MKTETALLPQTAGGLLLAGLCGAAFFLATQASGPLAAAGLFLRYDLVLLPALAAALFYFFARLPKPLGTAAVPLLTACLCGLVLAGLRESLVSDLSTLAGLYPHSDGRNYLNGALNLLHGQELNAFASRRPLSVVFWAALLRLSGLDIKTAMELMVFLCALSIGWSVRAVIRQFGWAAGWLLFCGLFCFYRRFIGAFLTEHLGLALGCFAFLLLLRSLAERRQELCFAGLLLLTLALNVRAGAFFILPALALWAGWHWRQAARFSFTAAGLAALAISSGFALNSSALHLVGQDGAGQGNFSFTLYGLVHGGDWTLVKEQHPEVLKLEEVERHKAIYQLAWDKIAAEPSSLLRGAGRAWAAFASISNGPYSYILFSLQQSFLDRPAAAAAKASSLREKLLEHPWKYLQIAAAYASSGLLLLLAALGFLAPQHRSAKVLLLCSWLGILASVPFVPPWDADLMRAYAATLPFMLLPAALGLVVLLSWLDFSKQTDAAYEDNERGLLLPISVTLLMLFLPIFFRPQKQAAAPLKITCQKGEPQLLSLLPGSVLHIGAENNPAEGSVSITAMRTRTGVLHSLNPRRADAFQHLSPGQTLALGYEHRSALLRYVVFPSDRLTTFLPQTTPVCASPVYDDGMTTWWSVRTE